MDAAELLHRLAEVIDGHRWDELPALLHEEFTCRLVHTGERFDREGWVRLNAEYPGFQRFILEETVACGDRAVGRAHVTATAEGQTQHFAVASFLTARDDLIGDLTEVWTDVGADPPEGTRPQEREKARIGSDSPASGVHHGVMSPTHRSSPPAHVVLVPGFWLGAWAWDEVLAHLPPEGMTVRALTLPGLEADHPDRGSVHLEDHVAAIEQALAVAPEGARTVLVAHSGAAVPATVALDRHVDEVDHVVWVDTAPVVDGYAIDPDAAGSEHPLSAQYDEELQQGAMAGLSEEQLATFRERAVPQPTASMREPVSLADERRLDVPGTIVCTAFPAADYRSYAEQGLPFLAGVLQHRHLELLDLPTGHWPMWSRPADLAEIIARAAARD